jgi:hypothetical protein
MRARWLLRLGGAAVLPMLFTIPSQAQVPYPEHEVEGVTWSSGVHNVEVSNRIIAPGDGGVDVLITGTAQAEFVSGTSIHLTDGFHAGGFTGAGQHFRARIAPVNSGPDDVVAIAPDPDTGVIDNELHVPKWEKVEIGVRLPQEYQDAIDSFFGHYYSNGDSAFATPDQLDRDHDLNPYADDSLLLVMSLTDPSGDRRMKWGFFMKEGTWSSSSDAATLVEDGSNPLHPYHVRYRIAPDEEGAWQFGLAIKAPHSTTPANTPLTELVYSGFSFHCDPPLPDNHGYLTVNDSNRRVLQFEGDKDLVGDETSFFAMGTNLGTGRIRTTGAPAYTLCQRDITYLRQAMEQLHGVEANYMRLFLMPRDFAPEFKNLGVYDAYYTQDPCAIYSGMSPTWGNCQFQCWAFDKILEHARQNDLYMQLAVDPYPPIVAYENFIWGDHPYMTQFIEPHPQAPPLNKYDIKRFFFNNGDPSTADEAGEVFYYWKRKYKYMMARWGYSVNVAAWEPFNEVDQLLSYSERTIDAICDENDGTWLEDDTLPSVLDAWLTRIISYVRGPVDTADAVGSPLGENKKLFLMSYTEPWPPPQNPAQYFLPFSNPEVDIIDVHKGLGDTPNALENSFVEGRNYRDNFLSNGHKKPFNRGEHTYYAGVDHDADPSTDNYESYKLFSNYDVSFHNELWASAFFGNMSGGYSWAWPRIFWWPNALPGDVVGNAIPYDWDNDFSSNHTGVLLDSNQLDVGLAYPVTVQNRTIYHNFKPLAEMLTNPDWLAYDFFSGRYGAHKVYDDVNQLECYFLKNEDSTVAIGWVHNLNSYWKNNFYVTSTAQDFLGCADPNADSLTLTGFQPGLPLHITWFPTRMDTTAYPASQVDSTGSGSVTLDWSSRPFNGIADDYLDTLHADYGFIIAPQPVEKSMTFFGEDDPGNRTLEWDFLMFPNPASNEVNVLFPDNRLPREIAIYDLAGKCVYHKSASSGVLKRIPVGKFSSGAYSVRASDAAATRVKLLIIQ